MSERKISFNTNNTYSNPKRSRIQKTTRGYVTKLNRDKEKQYQTRRVKLVEHDRKKTLIDSIKPSKAENKFNFLYWVVSIVLVLILGSFAITGYVNSKITENQTEKTITHTYQKQIGTEVVGGNFDFITSFDDFNSLIGVKIYPKELKVGDSLPKEICDYSGGYYNNFGMDSYLRAYDYNNNPTNRVNSYYSQRTRFGKVFYNFKYAYTFDSNYVITDISLRYDFYYMINERYTFSDSSSNVKDIDIMRLFMNTFYINDSYFERPIYETTTYSYKVKDINYNWQNKFSQLGYLKNIFNGNDKFYDESYNYYSSKKSLVLPLTNNNDYIREQIEEYYLTDEKVKLLYDYGILTFASKSKKIVSGGNPFKNEYYYYIVLNSDIVVGDENISSAINYVNENYITSFNIDYYLEVQPDDFSLLSIFTFPIQVIYRIMYNFGVIVNFIISW